MWGGGAAAPPPPCAPYGARGGHYCSNFPHLVRGKRINTKTFALQFSTRRYPCLNELYHLFYDKNKIKLIPYNIFELLTPVALAH